MYSGTKTELEFIGSYATATEVQFATTLPHPVLTSSWKNVTLLVPTLVNVV